ncbi:MAG TPA: hypothetical protein VIE68_00860 [Gemmatimonadota bacterium]|jgi:L-alanine-DL-glutamate epimerase-like enolase superfamily enzyme
MLSRALGPGALAERLASLAVRIDALAVERGSVPLAGYYDGAPRPTGIALLSGAGESGRGECVAWTSAEQDAFAIACGRLELPAAGTIEGLSLVLAIELDDPYHRAAVEGAALDLALRQAGTNPFRVAGRRAAMVRFCRSTGRTPDPLAAIAPVLAEDPEARLKLDVPAEGWPAATWEALARTRRVVVLDFKRESDLDQVRLAHRAVPDAWLEDPPPGAITLDPRGGWLARVALDGYVLAAVDLDDPEIPPAAVNVKAPRVGGWLEALRCLETCHRRGWKAYMGGMFEVDVGRAQARVLASLFTAESWNDLAPLGTAAIREPDDQVVGFGPD